MPRSLVLREARGAGAHSTVVGALVMGLLVQACGSSGSGASQGGAGGAGGTTGSAVTAGVGTGGGAPGATNLAGAGSGAGGVLGGAGSGTAFGGAGAAGVFGGAGSGAGGVGFGGGGSSSGGGALGGAGMGPGEAGSGGSNGGVGGVTAGAGGSAGPGGSAGAGGVAAFNPCPTTGPACQVMPLGDSITDGVGSSAPGGGYRLRLFHDAVQAHQALTFVGTATDPNGPPTLDGKNFPRDHEGHPGYTIDDSATTSGISPLVDKAIATTKPHIVLLMIGTNDLDRNIDAANAPTRLGALLDRIINDAPNALLVVAKITPTLDDGANGNVQTYNNAIAGLVQNRAASGKHVALVDMYAAITADTAYKTSRMNDFLHPNDAGYVAMGDAWYAAIQSYLPAAQ